MSRQRAILPVILSLSGAAAGRGAAAQRPLAAATVRRAPPAPTKLTIEPSQPGTGSLVRVVIPTKPGDSVRVASGELAGEALHFLPTTGGRRIALGAIPLDASDSVVARVIVDRASGAIDTLRTVLHYPHHPPAAPAPAAPARRATRAPGARRLRVDPKFTQRMDAETEARIEHDNELAREVGRRAHDTPQLWTFPFLRPRDSRVTSRFGSGRVFNGRLSSSHLGIDYRGAEGDPIVAANRGVVALVAEFFLAGNVVYIDHGAGVVTGYFHMSKPEVSVGDTVQRGQEIGLVGATGRVTGPHLHWSARFGALTIDPADLLSLSAPFIAPDSAPKKPASKPAPKRKP
ncbi:MAG: M23 family metallopeptidase [Gemmatimonadaceae bacterium]